MAGLAQRVAAFAKEHPEHASVIPLCKSDVDDPDDTASSANGYVYLVEDGRRYKIGRTRSVEDRIPELSNQSSHRIDLVHKIATDDPPGIEKYWHERFADKRKYGEWFDLDVRDVAAFRRRKKFM